MTRTRLHWSTGNRKLRKTGTISFNLPAFKSAGGFVVCPGAGGCASLCYAQQGRFTMPNAKRTREANLRIVRGDLARFERWAIADLTGRFRFRRSIRVHDSGDFFSQAYLDAWCRIAAALPDRRFYAYTKSLHLDFTGLPENVTVVRSVGGKWDAAIDHALPHSRIFVSQADRKAAGYVDGTRTDRAAQRGETRIGLVYHGSHGLKPGQVVWLQQQTNGGE